MVSHPHPVSAIVLAGGRSRRMGQDKALLPIAGQPLLGRILQRLCSLSTDVIVSSDDPGRYSTILGGFLVRTVVDLAPGIGPLGGIYTGLCAARHPQALVVACDMPFLNPVLLAWMTSLLADYDAVVPRVRIGNVRLAHHVEGESSGTRMKARDSDLHPLHAVYSKSCLAPIQAALTSDDRSLGSFISRLRVRVVEASEIAIYDPQFLSLRNVNQPDEYAAVLRLVEDDAQPGNVWFLQ